MQKSAHTNMPSRPRREQDPGPSDDKGRKHEPDWIQALGQDRRSLERLNKADRKR